MSATSHAFHILRDIQTFAAACVALVAAVVAYASQRYAANTQAKSARENTQQQISNQKQKEKDERSADRLGFAVRLLNHSNKAINELAVLKVQMNHIYTNEVDDKPIILSDYPTWQGVVAFKKLSEMYDFEAMFDKGFTISGQEVQRAFIDITSTLRRWDIGFAMTVGVSSLGGKIRKDVLGTMITMLDNEVSELKKVTQDLREIVKRLGRQSAYASEVIESDAAQHDASGITTQR